MLKSKILLIMFALIGVTVLTGCQISLGDSKDGGENDIGGVFKSVDSGESWQAKNLIPTTGDSPGSIAGVNIKRLVVDPQDHLTLYLATDSNGLLYSYDGADNWQVPREQPDFMKTIEDIAVDYKDSCTIYASAGNRIFKSINCSRTWDEIYFGTRQDDTIVSLAIDWWNSNIIYAGTSQGDILKSTDNGKSWAAVERTGNTIKKILIDPYDSRVVYVAMEDNGIFKTINKGESWNHIKDAITEIDKKALKFRDIILVESQKNSLIMASEYGLTKTSDGGATWQPIELVTDAGKADIRALAVDPKDADKIYYATDSTFYESIDGGEKWSSQKLPTSRAANDLLIDFNDTNVLYMGITKMNK